MAEDDEIALELKQAMHNFNRLLQKASEKRIFADFTFQNADTGNPKSFPVKIVGGKIYKVLA